MRSGNFVAGTSIYGTCVLTTVRSLQPASHAVTFLHEEPKVENDDRGAKSERSAAAAAAAKIEPKNHPVRKEMLSNNIGILIPFVCKCEIWKV